MSGIHSLAQSLHRILLWPATVAFLAFLISGLSHPVMVWTGPQASSFFPPQSVFSATDVNRMLSIVQQQPVTGIAVAKLVPGPAQNYLQLTVADSNERLYFDLDSGRRIDQQDERQARWLAAYYASRDISEITGSRLITAFSNEYPSVNRQLPVWRVDFAGSDNLSLYIHTETLTMAAINNDWKRVLQTVFQLLHTQSGFAGLPWLQFLVMNVLISLVIVFAVAGIVLIFSTPKRKVIPNRDRRWHRRLALALYVPLLMLMISGSYHLWFTYLDGSLREQRLPAELPTELATRPDASFSAAMTTFEATPLNQVSLLSNGDALYVRLGVPAGRMKDHVSREHHFHGQVKEQGGHYLALNSANAPLDDQAYALALAAQILGEYRQNSLSANTVRFFEPTYDFRNKRLPVMRVDGGNKRLYIDTATGILVDHVDTPTRYERLSFDMMHKWNWLIPITGRFGRDIIVVIFLLGMLAMLGYGLTLKLKQPRIQPRR